MYVLDRDGESRTERNSRCEGTGAVDNLKFMEVQAITCGWNFTRQEGKWQGVELENYAG